ncbi:hypothetical protein BURK1_03350 [Burkholderiales bacterium]|nr:hypothetical protein BURK1_03350 [Burkholderiales bacterium]
MRCVDARHAKRPVERRRAYVDALEYAFGVRLRRATRSCVTRGGASLHAMPTRIGGPAALIAFAG